MRILFLSSIYPRPYDPTRGIYCEHLCRALAAEHDVKVVSPRSWLERLRHGRLAPANDPGKREPTYPTWYYPPGMLRNASGWFMWTSIRTFVRRVVAEFSPDCVLSYWAHPDGEAAVRAARFAGVPVGLMVGGSDILLLPRRRGRRRRVASVLNATDAVLAVSQNLKEKTVALGVSPDRVHVVSQGVDTTQFAPGGQDEARRRLGIPTAGKILLWVGRMVPVKGLPFLLEALSQLRCRDIHLYLVGDGPSRWALEAECRKRGLDAAVTFVGTLSQGKLPDWYRAADLTVLPSLSEGIPNVLRESLACGTPFVASEVGGVPELKAGAMGRMIPPGNPKALAEALADMLAAPPEPTPVRMPCWASTAQTILSILCPLRAKTLAG